MVTKVPAEWAGIPPARSIDFDPARGGRRGRCHQYNGSISAGSRGFCESLRAHAVEGGVDEDGTVPGFRADRDELD
jgi:hypothetical protein